MTTPSQLGLEIIGYHAHADMQNDELSSDTLRALVEAGMEEDHFIEGSGPSIPKHHFSVYLGPEDSQTFRKVRDELRVCFAALPVDNKGYLETEVVWGSTVQLRPEFSPGTDHDIKLDFRDLNIDEQFRECEFHLTFNVDDLDPILAQILEDQMHLVPSRFIRDETGDEHIIFTAQGSKAVIYPLLHEILEYLNRAGGAKQVEVELEIVVSYFILEGSSVPAVVSGWKIST